MSKRSYIDVGVYSGTTGEEDPLELFAYMVRKKYGKGTEKVQKSNTKLLESLYTKGQLPKSNIVWNPHNDSISRIYGFKVDDEGYIQYDTLNLGSNSNSPNRSRSRKEQVSTDRSYIDISALRNAIVRSKEIVI